MPVAKRVDVVPPRVELLRELVTEELRAAVAGGGTRMNGVETMAMRME